MQKMRNKSQRIKGKAGNGSRQKADPHLSQSNKNGENAKSAGGKFGNDPNWYNLDPRITRDAASFPYAIPTGSPIITGSNWNPRDGRNYTVPGVMAISLAPTVGTAYRTSDPINMAAQQMYAFITHANSRNTSYDAADLMQYVLAMSETYSYVEFLKRAYGVARLYTYDNKYIPSTLLTSMHVDPSDIRYKMADFRLGINMLVNKLAAFAVPNTMSIFARKAFLYKGLYTEGMSTKDQIYLYVPESFMIWDWKNNSLRSIKWTELGSELSSRYPELSKRYSAPYSVDALLSIGNTMIDLLLTNADMGTMNGDILKAYGNNIISIDQIAEDYVVAPVVNVGVLEQMQNATFVNEIDINSLSVQSKYVEDGIEEGASILFSVPSHNAASYSKSFVEDWDASTYQYADRYAEGIGLRSKKIMMTAVSEPDPAYNMEISRLMVGDVKLDTPIEYEYEDGAAVSVAFGMITGSEIPVHCHVYVDPYKDPIEYRNMTWVVTESSNLDYSAFLSRSGHALSKPQFDKVRLLTALSSFEYAPVFYGFSLIDMESVRSSTDGLAGESEVPVNVSMTNIKRNNYTTISLSDLYNMHNVAMLNLYYVPKVALNGYK